MSETRKITVTGGSAVFSVDGDNRSTTAKTRRKRNESRPASPQSIVKVGGEAPAPLQKRESPAESDTKAITVQSASKAEILGGKQSSSNGQESLQDSSKQEAPVPHSKVILGGKKPKHMKVVLTKKNHDAAAAQAQTPASKARKVSLGITHLKRRVTRARRLNKLSKTAPLEQIRKELIAAHIIKEDSKAPESILRQMYADAKLLTTKSL